MFHSAINYDKKPPQEAINCLVSMIVNDVMPTLEMFKEAESEIDSIIKLLNNKDMPVPKEVQELSSKQ